MKPFWVRFEMPESECPKFEYHGPWWITGSGFDLADNQIFCAAVMAEDAEAAKRIIIEAHDDKREPTFSFVNEQPSDWDPLKNEGGRFPPKKWMKWPWPDDRCTTRAEGKP